MGLRFRSEKEYEEWLKALEKNGIEEIKPELRVVKAEEKIEQAHKDIEEKLDEFYELEKRSSTVVALIWIVLSILWLTLFMWGY